MKLIDDEAHIENTKYYSSAWWSLPTLIVDLLFSYFILKLDYIWLYFLFATLPFVFLMFVYNLIST